MSSNEEDSNDLDFGSNALAHGSKKRRIQRACDICRRKKIRCDGGQMPDSHCSNCVTYNFPCTYVEAAKKRGPPKGYVESLENRVEKLESLLRKICPDKEVLRELNASLESSESFQNPSSLVGLQCNGFLPATDAFGRTPREIATSALRKADMTTKEEPDDDSAHLLLADNLRRLTIDPHEYRFFGKSSGAMLIQTAMELKHEYTSMDDSDKARNLLKSKRPEYWAIKPQSTAISQLSEYTFPPDDLISSLIDLYFQHLNLFFPLLHRPTFDRCIAEGLHHTNLDFGAVLLLVCATGARHSDDRRVVLDIDDGHHSAGWKWFEQVQLVRRTLLAPPNLYDLQLHCLTVQYLQGSSAPHACWTMVGIGIRFAQDVGVHRKKVDAEEWTVEDELRKRAFWVLVCMDRALSCALGRPCAIQDEDFDVDYPLEVDDEYWEHPDPKQMFKQPPGKPSLITAFNLFVKLNHLLAFTLRTIYSINKSKVLLGFVGEQWEQHIVAELDSALNRWVDSVPDSLRWDPKREHPLLFQQSVLLYSTYYYLQILIHRPFIPSRRKPSPLSFPSLAICTNAARSCSHVAEVMRKRDLGPAPWVVMAVFTSCIVLLLNIWGGKRSGLSTDTHKEMSEVHKCMSILRLCEERYYSAGRLWDILYELASIGELPLPQPSPPISNKRERDEDAPSLDTSPSPPGVGDMHDVPRPIIGYKRISRATSQFETSQRHLPVYSNDLGQLPPHGQAKFVNSQFSADFHQNRYIANQQAMAGQSGYWPVPSTSQMSQQQFIQPQLDQGFVQGMGLGGAPSLAYNQMAPQSTMMNVPQSTSNMVPGLMQNQAIPSSNIAMDPLLVGAGYTGRGDIQGMQTVADVNAGLPPIDFDAMAMWSNAPTGFELDDWGAYLSNFSELTHGMAASGSR